ncbi:MAG: diadenylate cyclase CdaA [Oscillospiraceae bacterium]|nr:diadenylate cyclase CdaA [Oscillospiraceae bacterium]
MAYLSSILEGVLRFLGTIALTDWLDILILAYLLYRALLLVGRSRAENLGRTVIYFLFALALSVLLRLNTINAILRAIVTWGVIGLIVIFQPEIRRLLEQVGSSKFRSFNPFARVQRAGVIETAIAQTVSACAEMSEQRTGVLMVFERSFHLDDIARTGTIVDAQVSAQLLKNIFFVKAALHDGAVIVRNGRLLAAGCILPLSHNGNISRDLGTRHRAGIGMSENSDAVVVIVSEETGAISVAIRGMLKRHLTPQTLETLLRNELLPALEDEQPENTRFRIPWLRKREKEAKHDADE